MLATGCAATNEWVDELSADMDGELQDEVVSASEPAGDLAPIVWFRTRRPSA